MVGLRKSALKDVRFEFRGLTPFVVLAVLTVALSTVGCRPAVQTEGSRASAEEKLKTELNKWVAKQNHEATHFDLLGGILLDFKIQSLQAVTADILDSVPEWNKQNPPPAFLAAVKVDYQSRGNTTLTKVILYRLAWHREKKAWAIHSVVSGD